MPLVLSKLVGFISEAKFKGDTDFTTVYWYGVYIILLCLGNVTVGHLNFFIADRMGMRVRIACCSLIYRKSLKLSAKSLQQTTAGQIVDLLSNDVNRFDEVFDYSCCLF